mgnify:CR=1 FL=1
MSKKIERNDPCWCGSGKKYKKCHEAFDEKMEIMKQKGYAVIDHDLIKTPEQIAKIKESCKINIAVLDYVEEHINAAEPKAFTAIKENLLLIEEYRNNIVHYYNEQLEPYIFMLTAKAALNYVEFMKKYFSKDILNSVYTSDMV